MFDGEKFGQEMVEIIKGYVQGELKEALAPLLERLDSLEAAMNEVRQKGLTYRGVWQRAADYERGAIVTLHGTAWAAVKAIKDGEEPGKDGAWQMMLKGR